MEVAGLVLGALPLALKAIDCYSRCAQLASDYHKYESTIEAIRNHVFIQQEQLVLTLKGIGLLNPTPAELETALRRLFPEKYNEFIQIIYQMWKILDKMMKKLDIDMDGRPRWTSEPPERATWEWNRVKNSFKKNSREKSFKDLQFLNNALARLLEPVSKKELPLAGSATDIPNATLEEIRARFDSKRCNSVRKSVCLVHKAATSAWRCHHSHYGNLKLSWHDATAASNGGLCVALSTSVEAKDTSVTAENWQELEFDIDAASCAASSVPAASARLHSLSRSSLRPTFLPALSTSSTASQQSSEPLQRRPSPSPLSAEPTAKDTPRVVSKSWFKAAFRAALVSGTESTGVQAATICPPALEEPPSPQSEALVSASPSTADVICLCTFLHDPTAYSGRLRSPDANSVDNDELEESIVVKRNRVRGLCSKAIPLREVFKPSTAQRRHRGGSGSLALSLRERLSIAAAATWAVLHLAESPWLSPDWVGKDRLQLLLKGQGAGERYPTISATLRQPSSDAQPPSLPDPQTEELRPLTSIVRNSTLFSLGILLIELCLNKPIEQLHDECVSASLPFAADEEIASKLMDEVYSEGGDFYGYAVQRCLRFEFPGKDITKSFHFEQFRRDFFSCVVAPVQATFVLLPSL